ncbi:hypothetical protein Gotur_006471 [Gossypium turneri]
MFTFVTRHANKVAHDLAKLSKDIDSDLRLITPTCYMSRFCMTGGITSSDLATKALEAKRAKVVGQALAGIPLWELGHESRHPGVPYIVFPGNVGDSKALGEVVRSWAHPLRLSSTKEILINAEKGGYAVGAFNVYNMEGVKAVVSAAEQERSPAILQGKRSANLLICHTPYPYSTPE